MPSAISGSPVLTLVRPNAHDPVRSVTVAIPADVVDALVDGVALSADWRVAVVDGADVGSEVVGTVSAASPAQAAVRITNPTIAATCLMLIPGW